MNRLGTALEVVFDAFVDTTSASITSLCVGSVYVVAVFSGSADGVEASGSRLRAATLYPPEKLHVTSIGASHVDVEWNGAIGADTYRIERKIESEVYAIVAGSVSGMRYSVAGLDSGVANVVRMRSRCVADGMECLRALGLRSLYRHCRA